MHNQETISILLLTVGERLIIKFELSTNSKTATMHVTVIAILQDIYQNVNQLKSKDYLQKVPIQEKCVILGCQWLSVEWKPSMQLVWASLDNLLMAVNLDFLSTMLDNFSCAIVPIQTVKKVQIHLETGCPG